jgi:hypothetical protein
LTIYRTWHFPNFIIFSIFYSVVLQIYHTPFIPKTQNKNNILLHYHACSSQNFVSKCTYFTAKRVIVCLYQHIFYNSFHEHW